jgi:hypothetical protein
MGKGGIMKGNKNKGIFAKYFKETKKKINGEFTTLKWLQYLDPDSLALLNSNMDNFDEKMPVSNIDDAMDIIELADNLALKEMKHMDFPIVDSSILLTNLKNLVTIEIMNRKGLVIIGGSGKITDFNTSFNLTDDGIETQSLLNSQREINHA